jgi:hypothetical protein
MTQVGCFVPRVIGHMAQAQTWDDCTSAKVKIVLFFWFKKVALIYMCTQLTAVHDSYLKLTIQKQPPIDHSPLQSIKPLI